MKKSGGIFLALVVGLISLFNISANASVVPGTKCLKKGNLQVYKGKIYTCIKLGKKLYWNNGVKYILPKPSPKQTITSIPTPTMKPAPTPSTTSIALPTSTSNPSIKGESGVFSGPSVNVNYGTVQVQVTLVDGQITMAVALQAPRGTSQQWSDQAVPELVRQTLCAQSDQIQGVSGASYTSYGWYKSLQEVLSKKLITAHVNALNCGSISDQSSIISPQASKCVVGAKCGVGSIGPGGGIVYYDAGSQQTWGRYLEFAPGGWAGWAQDPTSNWCNIFDQNLGATIEDPTLSAAIGFEIGTGGPNTIVLTSKCQSGAAVLAHSYHGGGLSDWILPSKDELNELWLFLSCQNDLNAEATCGFNRLKRYSFETEFYWSSSEYLQLLGWGQYFDDGNQITDTKSASDFVRPIRKF